MIVYTTDGKQVSIVDDIKGALVDSEDHRWARDAHHDTPEHAAFSDPSGNVLLLDRPQLVRVCAGVKAIRQVTSLEEARDYLKHMPPYLHEVTDSWTDETLSVFVNESNDAAKAMFDMAEKLWDKAHPPKKPVEAPREPAEAPLARKTPKRAPRGKVQEGGFGMPHEGRRLILTPKQVEFMERLSENEGWDTEGPQGAYYADSYAEALSDTMTPMGVGAMITTLREKGILTTEYSRVGGCRKCQFTLTELGRQVYNKLAGGCV